jgi:DNA-binding transcriptional regulator/RsmH inhibitor MraZ
MSLAIPPNVRASFHDGASHSFCYNDRHVEFYFYQINQFELIEKVLHDCNGSC